MSKGARRPRGRVLCIAGSDSGGGAGIQADIKTITSLGGYAATAVTAVTAQDTLAVHAMMAMPPAFVREQIEAVLGDIGADAVKTGLLGDAAMMTMVAETLARIAPGVALVLDPVMVAKAGMVFMPDEAVTTYKRVLLPLAALVTPNLPEAEALTGLRIASLADMRNAAEVMLTLGVPAVLLKGGHLPGPVVTDMLATEMGVQEFQAPRIDTRHTHGTGCTLASGIATGLAQGMGLRDAVIRARLFVRAAIAAAPGFGAGQGPLGHAAACWGPG